MKLNSPKNAKKTLCEPKFKIGDLVCYSPYFNGDGAWIMQGDMGIIVDIRTREDYQVYCIKWIDPALGSSDMAPEVLVKIELDKKE
jgi:hypothetical protein